MKTILLPIALLVTVFTACKTEEKKDLETSRQLLLTRDTSNLYPSGAGSDVATTNTEYTAPKKNIAVAPKRKTQPKYNAPVAQPLPPAPVPVVTAPPVAAATIPEVITPAPAPATIPTETTTTAPVVNKKKGISDAAKGAAIGGVGGAVAGAVIGKNGKGAIIGGVIGAAGGYILGRQKDKKSGRIDYATN